MLCAGEFKLQPEPSLVLSQLAQRQTPSALSHTSPLPLARQPQPQPPQQPPQQQQPQTPTPPPATSAGTLEPFSKPQEPSLQAQQSDAQAVANAQQQRQMKTQKRRIPPTSKVSQTPENIPVRTPDNFLNFNSSGLLRNSNTQHFIV